MRETRDEKGERIKAFLIILVPVAVLFVVLMVGAYVKMTEGV